MPAVVRNRMILLRYILIFFSVSFASQGLSGQSKTGDTVFILKERHHSIFIDNNRGSKFYGDICDFSMDEFEQRSYNNSLDYLREKGLKLTKRTIGDVPPKWIALKQYKKRYYSYYPSDFYTHYKIGLTDTTFIDYTGEGPLASKILSFRKIDGRTYRLELTGINDSIRNLTIHIIDKNLGIAVFEENAGNRGSVYFLMISEDKIRNLPIIVNYCESSKQRELEFEEPDFKALLRSKK